MPTYVTVKEQMAMAHDTWAEAELRSKGSPNAWAQKMDDRAAADSWALRYNESKRRDQERFESRNFIKVFCDGGYSLKPTPVFGWGILAVGTNGETLHEGNGIVLMSEVGEAVSQRNIISELRAAREAVTWARNTFQQVVIVYDYAGIENWARGYWTPKSKYVADYVDFMQKNKELVAGFYWTPGHTGIEGNERADFLAAQAIIEYKKRTRDTGHIAKANRENQ
jgi:ribonuclease H-related protein